MLTVCPEKRMILHLKFYAEYKDSAHIKKSIDQFSAHCFIWWISIHASELVNEAAHLGIWDTLFSKFSTLEDKNAGFKWFNFYVDFVA